MWLGAVGLSGRRDLYAPLTRRTHVFGFRRTKEITLFARPHHNSFVSRLLWAPPNNKAWKCNFPNQASSSFVWPKIQIRDRACCSHASWFAVNKIKFISVRDFRSLNGICIPGLFPFPELVGAAPLIQCGPGNWKRWSVRRGKGISEFEMCLYLGIEDIRKV